MTKTTAKFVFLDLKKVLSNCWQTGKNSANPDQSATRKEQSGLEICLQCLAQALLHVMSL